jgi:hypothetical protein
MCLAHWTTYNALQLFYLCDLLRVTIVPFLLSILDISTVYETLIVQCSWKYFISFLFEQYIFETVMVEQVTYSLH